MADDENKKVGPLGDKNVRPFDNAFQQLKLKSMMPRHSPQLVVACTILVACIFIPIGVSVILVSDQTWEREFRYDTVRTCTSNNNDALLNLTVATGELGPGGQVLTSTVSQGCQVRITFDMDQTITKPIYMYYRIKGMYQNYRDYIESTNMEQLLGNKVKDDDINPPSDSAARYDCAPFAFPDEYTTGGNATIAFADGTTKRTSEMHYSPCGAIAWSMFNDSFALYKNPGAAAVTQSATLPAAVLSNVVCSGDRFDTDGTPLSGAGDCRKSGIALKVDVDSRFKAPFPGTADIDWTHDGIAGASNGFLANGYYNNEPGHKVPKTMDEDYMVWARTAPMPDFRKLYRILDTDLSAGSYVIDIKEFYDTSSFGGEKSIILATNSWIGGKNQVLGILFLVFGALSFVLAIVFFLVALIKKPDTSESSE